ncbi:MAG: hypothetical protein HZB65_02055 [Candidatus Aenigmarchaeota archaeon]|nr:hypothetical protein [Candidatus Aenigmarchaeota archaeon]
MMSLGIELDLDEIEKQEEDKQIELLENKIHEIEIMEDLLRKELRKVNENRRQRISREFTMKSEDLGGLM